MDKKVDVKKKYSREFEDIDYILRNLENGRYYENTNARGDGGLVTNIQKLRANIVKLINKIEYDKESIDDQILEAFIKTEK